MDGFMSITSSSSRICQFSLKEYWHERKDVHIRFDLCPNPRTKQRSKKVKIPTPPYHHREKRPLETPAQSSPSPYHTLLSHCAQSLFLSQLPPRLCLSSAQRTLLFSNCSPGMFPSLSRRALILCSRIADLNPL